MQSLVINHNIVTDMDVFNVNVKIQIGVTDELFKLLQPVISGLSKPQVENEKHTSRTEEVTEAKEEAKEETEEKTEEKTEEVTEAKEETEEKTEEVTEAKEETEEKTEEKTEAKEAKKEYTEVDVRAAMDATRKRIEGEDYKTNTESEGRKNWHRKLTAWFKNTAAILGADKPSELPDSASRAAFIACCERVTVENNELIENTPF